MPEETTVLWALAAGAVLKAAALSWLWAKKRREYVGTVSCLYIYPVKSCREIAGLDSCMVTKHGLKVDLVADRHWMVSKDGVFYNMRMDPHLALIQPHINKDTITLTSGGHKPLTLPVDPVIQDTDIRMVRLKDMALPAYDCGDEAAGWICTVLQKEGLRLSFSAPSLDKRLSSKVHKDWPTQIGADDKVAFQDYVHCMIMSESSVDALNKRLKKSVTCLNFRPNIMVKGSTPFDEDNWSEVYIGDKVRIRFVDKCSRCIMINVDPLTGEKDRDEQPMKELKRFRCMAPYTPKPCMGIHMSTVTEGVISIGDPVYIVRE